MRSDENNEEERKLDRSDNQIGPKMPYMRLPLKNDSHQARIVEDKQNDSDKRLLNEVD